MKNNFQLLFDSAPDPYLIITIDDGVIIECNNATEEILGAHKSQIIGLTFIDISPEYQYDGKGQKKSLLSL